MISKPHLATLAAAMVLPFGAAPTAAPSAPGTFPATPGFYRFDIGRLHVTALSDGTVAVPFDKLLRGRTPEEIGSSFARLGEAPDRPTSVNAFLVDTGARRILIDTGAGTQLGACCGRLPQSLRSAGYSPETVDAIVLTHIHGDHSGGLSIDARRVFPNATLYVARREYAFWMDPTNEAKAKPQHRFLFPQARAALTPYVQARRVKLFDAPADVLPGVSAVPAPGHTPGHVLIRVADGRDSMLAVGDLVHAAEMQIPDPAVTIDFDVDQDAARATRRRVLAELARSRELVAFDHVSFPGIGHVAASGAGYLWAPAPYSAGPDPSGRPVAPLPYDAHPQPGVHRR